MIWITDDPCGPEPLLSPAYHTSKPESIVAARNPSITPSRPSTRSVARPLAATLAVTAALTVLGAVSAMAAYQGTPEQRRACTPDVYRLCAGEIPSVPKITACLRRNKANLSEACRAVFEQ